MEEYAGAEIDALRRIDAMDLNAQQKYFAQTAIGAFFYIRRRAQELHIPLADLSVDHLLEDFEAMSSKSPDLTADPPRAQQ